MTSNIVSLKATQIFTCNTKKIPLKISFIVRQSNNRQSTKIPKIFRKLLTEVAIYKRKISRKKERIHAFDQEKKKDSRNNERKQDLNEKKKENKMSTKKKSFKIFLFFFYKFPPQDSTCFTHTNFLSSYLSIYLLK